MFVTSEFEDFVRVGGLASVAAALTRAIRQRFDVRLVLPGFAPVIAALKELTVVGRCEAFGALPGCSVARGVSTDGLIVYVVLCAELYQRDGSPYCDPTGRDWEDNDIRFARFASAAAELAAGGIDPAWCADLVHVNDWQTALVPAYLAWRQARIPSLLTIHNLAYQGLFPASALGRLGIPSDVFHMEGVEFYGQLSFLKAGIVYASALTTVSRTYAAEITTPALGCGLHGLLSRRMAEGRLTGILNGIDDSWDPRFCSALAAPFSSGEWDGKRLNAEHVRREFGLALSSGPLFATVARLVHQKGIDLIASAIDAIVEAGGQLIVTGRGEAHLERALQDAQARHPQSIGVALNFDDGQARRIFAGSDFTLIPSRYEPCGLSQMYAQRFGSLPIGHCTGGLSETIVDGETGFLFDRFSVDGMFGALCRAFSAFGARHRLNAMRSSAMSRSFAWIDSARAYERQYESIWRAPHQDIRTNVLAVAE